MSSETNSSSAVNHHQIDSTNLLDIDANPQELLEDSEMHFKQQLERITGILENEQTSRLLKEQKIEVLLKEKKIISDTMIDQKNRIKYLKDRLTALLSYSTREVATLTEETHSDIEIKLGLASVIPSGFQPPDEEEVRASLQVHPSENDSTLDPDFVFNVMMLVEVLNQNESCPEEVQRKNSTQNEEKAETKKTGALGLFKKLNPFEKSSKNKKPLILSPDFQDPLTKTKEQKWKDQILVPVLQGGNIWSKKEELTQLIKSTVPLPYQERGFVWNKLIGNRGQVTPRMFHFFRDSLVIDPESQLHKSIQADMAQTLTHLTGPHMDEIRSDATRAILLFSVALF